MRQLVFFLFVATFVLVALGATQIHKHGHIHGGKHRKPSLPKKYLVEDGGFLKLRKVRAIVSQYELRERHRLGRQLPGVRSGGGGYLYNRPVYTSSDHLAARPALPLTEVESHPLSNFPAHYSGDLEDESKDDASKAKAPVDGEKTPAPTNSTAKGGAMTDTDKMKADQGDSQQQPQMPDAKQTPDVSKQDVFQEKSEPVAVAVPASAVVPVGKNMQGEQDLDQPGTSDSGKAGSGSEPAVVVTQQETVAGKPPVAME